MSDETTPDWWARGFGIAGILIGLAAIVVPVLMERSERQERLGVWMRPNSEGVVLLPDDPTASNVIQVPWLVTLSNTGSVTFSITAYDVVLVEGQAISRYSNMVNLPRNADNTPLILPISLGPGESTTIKLHFGFMSQPDVMETLVALQSRIGAFTLNESFTNLASNGMTIYGGTATYEEFEGGGTLITLGSETPEIEPIYRIEFITGRN